MKTLKNPPSSALSFIPQRETGSPLHLLGVFFMEKPKLIKDLGYSYFKPDSKQKIKYGIFECPYCGSLFKTGVRNVIRGDTTSCGCYRDKVVKNGTKRTHGLTHTRIFKIWMGLRWRCTRKATPSVFNKNYRGRGIKVYDAWDKSFMSFYNWSMSNGYSDKLEIDRIDVDGDYCPENCRWVDGSVNAQNTRLLRIDNKTGYRCVYSIKNKWIATIGVNKKYIHLGSYNTPEEAALAYNNFVIKNKTFHPLNIIPNDKQISG